MQLARVAIAGMEVGILVAFGVVFGGIMEPAGVLHGDLVALLWVVDAVAFMDDLLLDAHFAEEGMFLQKLVFEERIGMAAGLEPKGGEVGILWMAVGL
jgi:hypothetical protein